MTILDENFNWKQQISDIACTLDRVNASLSELTHFLDRKIQETIYHPIFELPIYIILFFFRYKIQTQRKDFLFFKRNPKVEYVSLITMLIRLTYSKKPAASNHLIKLLWKSPFHKYFNKVFLTIFKNWFTLSNDSHTYKTWSNLGCLVPPHNTKL